MKHFNKFMVVPYSMDPIEKYLSDLDTQMSEVLKNKKIIR